MALAIPMASSRGFFGNVHGADFPPRPLAPALEACFFFLEEAALAGGIGDAESDVSLLVSFLAMSIQPLTVLWDTAIVAVATKV